MKQIQLKLQESLLARILPNTLEDTIVILLFFLKRFPRKTLVSRETVLGLAVVFPAGTEKSLWSIAPGTKQHF